MNRSALTRKIVAGSVVAFALTAGLNVIFQNPEKGAYDVAKESLTTLSPKTTAFLATLSSPVKITYYVTEKKRMPTALRSMEREVRALLRQMTRWAPASLTIDIVHPEDQPQDVRGLGRFRLSSFQYKTILKDEYNVSTVWSGLLIEYKGVSRAIPYLTPDHLPHLENRIVTHLHHIETHYAPTVAIRSPKKNQLLASTLETLNMGQPAPWTPGEGPAAGADVAFLLQPEHMTPTEVESVDRFLKDGKDVYVFFSPYRSIEKGDQVGIVPVKSGLEDFLAKRGVTVELKLLMMPRTGTGPPNDLVLPASLANLEGFVLTAQGSMLFPQASPIVFDPVKAKAAGIFSRTLLISDEKSWTRSFGPDGGTLFSKTDLETPPQGTFQSETIGIRLASEKPWEGKLFLFSSGYLIDDAAAQVNQANGLYLKNLLMSFAKPEGLTSIQASRKIKPTVPPLSRSARLLWRMWAMGLFPLVGLIGLFYHFSPQRTIGLSPSRKGATAVSLTMAGFVLLAGLLIFMNRWSLPAWDVTKNHDHTLSPLTLKKIRELNQPVKITFYHSTAENLPRALKIMGQKTEATLERFARANRSHLLVKRVSVPDDAADTLLDELARVRVTPFIERVIEQDRYIEKKIYSALVFETATQAQIVPRFTYQNIDRLEFLTVSALTRLQGSLRPSIGILVDLPRLTAAEFWELEQLNVKVMPKSEDVYARLIDLLRNEGYAVRLYDSKTETPGQEDVLLYLQPWLITPPIRETLAKRLHDGGKVMIAAQHYRMQARKYPGHAYALVYWPQPQFSRINEFLEFYGVELVKEVFLDQSKAPTASREQINWGAYRKEEMRAPDAQPFLIRAIAENFAKNSPVTARLSDLLFIWGNRWRKLPGLFPPTLQWIPLVSSSKDAWAIDWQGGFLSPDALREGNYTDAPQPLVVELAGLFPMEKEPPSSAKPGRLMLVGCSEILSNENLDNVGYDNPKFFLNAVASLAYGSDMAWIQARGATTGEGFPFVPPAKKLTWRLFVLALIPTSLGLPRLAPTVPDPQKQIPAPVFRTGRIPL
ncbi:MAG: GldG family protein [Elusimicrobia bacterium]|nr:GldG family protein [Elusimicrobiota bacterium]